MGGFGSDDGDFRNLQKGQGNIFVLKLTATLTNIWLKTYGGNDRDACYGVVTDANSNIYVTGGFRSNSVVFQPASGFPFFTPAITVNHNTASAGDIDNLVFSLDVAGGVRWAITTGGIGQDRGWDITIANNILYCAGEVGGDAFISSLNPTNRSFNWTRTFGGAGSDMAKAISVGTDGNIYTAGSFSGTVDFDPNAGVQNLVGTGASNGFISSLDVNGNLVSANQISSNGSATAEGVALDATNRIHVTGDFTNTVRLNPSNTVLNNETRATKSTYTAVYVPVPPCSVVITPASLPNNIAGTPYNQTLTQIGSTGTQIWSITGGALPTGLTLNPTTGVISGIRVFTV